MTSYTIPYERGRAVALAAIMVLSVVAMSTAFAGAAAADVTSADRTIEDPVLGPGDSTTVTVEVELDDGENPGVFEAFDPAFAEVRITDVTDPVNAFTATKDDEAVAFWDGTYDQLVLEYEVTVPEDAEDGDVFTFSGEADDAQNELTISGDSTITVTDAEQTDLSFEIGGQTDALTLEEGESAGYIAEAIFDDGSAMDVTDDVGVTAVSGDVDAVEINELTNEITAVEPGTVTVEADDGEFTDDVEVTVEPEPELVDLELEVDGQAGAVSIDDGETVGYTVEATFEDGSTEDVTGEVDMASVDGNGEISINLGAAEVTGEAPGTVTLEAIHGELTDEVEVTVEHSLSTYAEDDGTVTTNSLRDAINDWRNDEISTELLRDVIDAWRSS